MTFVGKLLVVVQLVLAVCFMAFAGAVYTAETNWRDKAVAAQDQAAQAQRNASDLTAQLQQTEQELGGQIEQLNMQVALLDNQVAQATEQLRRTEQERDAARTAVDRATAVAQTSAEAAKFRQDEALRQRERNQRLQDQINELQDKARELEDTVFERDRTIASMQSRNEDNIKQLATYRQMILALNGSLNPENYPDLVSITEPPPRVTGVVQDTKVSPTSGVEFVEISLGKDDGLKVNDVLQIFRGSDYLGKMKLTMVEADSAVGQVQTPRPRNGTIQKGDNVTTQF